MYLLLLDFQRQNMRANTMKSMPKQVPKITPTIAPVESSLSVIYNIEYNHSCTDYMYIYKVAVQGRGVGVFLGAMTTKIIISIIYIISMSYTFEIQHLCCNICNNE